MPATSLGGEARFISFRDPAGHTCVRADRVVREVHASAWASLESFLKTPLSSQLVEEGCLVSTRTVSEGNLSHTVAHERIPFVSYPFEWAPQMLQAAGHLVLSLAERVLAAGFGLKDASPYNVLFRGSNPVFVDLLSFEERTPGNAVWLPYGQFVRNFSLPLLIESRFGMPVKATFLANRDGVEPETVYQAIGPLQKLLPPVLTLVTIPTWLDRSGAVQRVNYAPSVVPPNRARFALNQLYRTGRRQLERVAARAVSESRWTSYERSCTYSFQQALQKRGFVEEALRRLHPARLLDVGCNTGSYSRLAAQLGSEVVAIDSDPKVVGHLWTKARAENLNILPLVIDITRPSPGMGWRNLECESFLSRCERRFDCMVMLGIIHHLLVTERIPLESILDLAADLTIDSLIIEYIGPEDPMFRRLLRGREHLHEGLNQESFERAFLRRFRLMEKASIGDSGRVIYLLRRRQTV